MTQHPNLGDLTKKELRSVLQSSAESVTLEQLQNDFRKLLGYDIPYRRMGYNTLSDFLYDIPDVVSCRKVYDRLMITAIADSSTAHIARLVARQKSRKRSRGGRGRGSSSAGDSRGFSTQRMPFSVARNHPSPPVNNPDTKSSLYSICRGQVKELLFAYPDGIPLRLFDEAFVAKFGSWPPVAQLDFYNTTKLLESMQDILSLESGPNGTGVMVVCTCWPQKRHQSTDLSADRQRQGYFFLQDHRKAFLSSGYAQQSN